MSAKNEWGLTPQQEVFAQEVAKGKSLSDAYRQAYPLSKKWKDDSVHNKASALLRNAQVAARVAMLRAAAADRAELDASAILKELKRLAHSDIAGITDENGRVKLPHELDPATRASIASFKIDEYGRIEYKFWPKTQAIDMAMKHLGLFKEDNKQKGTGAAEFLASLQSNVLGVVKDRPKEDDDE